MSDSDRQPPKKLLWVLEVFAKSWDATSREKCMQEVAKSGGTLYCIEEGLPSVLTFELPDESSFDQAYSAVLAMGFHAEPAGCWDE